MVDPSSPDGRFVLGSPDGIAVADSHGVVRLLNPAGRRLLAVPDDADLTDASVAAHLTHEACRAWRAVDSTGQGRWAGRSTVSRWDGSAPVDVNVSTYVLESAGEPRSLVVVLRDAQQAQAAELALQSALSRLDAAELRHRTVLRHMSDVLLVLDADGDLVYASASASVLAGLPDELFRLHAAVLHGAGQSDEDLLSQLGAVFDTPGHHETVRMRLRTRDGVLRVFEANAENVLDDPGMPGVIVMLRDITERDRAEQALAGQTRVLEMIARGEALDPTLEVLARAVEQEHPELLCAVLVVTDDGGPPRLRLAAAPSVPADHRSAIDGVPVDDPSSPCSRAALQGEPLVVSDLEHEGAAWPDLRELARGLGVTSLWAYPVVSPGSGAVVGVVALYGMRPGPPGSAVADVVDRAVRLTGIAADRARLEVRLSHQATHDELTGLPNRTLLLDRLQVELARRPAAHDPVTVVLFIDLDRLKVVNDSLGHEVGDQLLRAVGRRLESVVRPADTVSRFGGDEFVVIAEEADAVHGPALLAQRVVDALSRPLLVQGRTLSTAASVGVVMAAGYASAADVLRDADTAMYRAKGRGGNRFELFDPSMRERALARLELEHAIRTGLAAGEFEVAYQPIVDLADPGRPVVGLEALARWRHPARGLLDPDEFLDVAEETGLVVPLGELVLRTASRAAGEWGVAVDLPLGLSVNLSLQQLGTPGLDQAVVAAAAAARPWPLLLELTESMLSEGAAHARGQIAALAAVGVELSIDDFGTGSSSLRYLTGLPVRTVKIDRSFVSRLGLEPEAEAVAAATLGLADRLGLSVVAEGVESREQELLLVELGCRYAQGFWFHPPRDAEAVRALLAR